MYQVQAQNSDLITVSGDINRDVASEFRKAVEDLIWRGGDRVEINLDGLNTSNSVMLSLCLCFLRKAKLLNKQVEFSGTPGKLFDMARVGGVEFIFSQSSQ